MRLSAKAQQKGRNIRLLRQKQKSARSRKVEAFWIAPGGNDDRARAADAEAVRGSLQDLLGCRAAHDDEALRIEAEAA